MMMTKIRCGVPMMVPSAVSALVKVSFVDPGFTGADLANPKSSSFTPSRVSMMLPGFASRWVTPAFGCAT